MELCYNLQTCAEHSSLERDIELCSQAGFRFVEIDFAKAEAYLQNHTPDDLTLLLQGNDIRCATINAIFGLSFCTKEAWEKICARFDLGCMMGKAVGADTIIVLTSERKDLPDGVTDSDIFTDTVKALQKLADRGSPCGMRVALEPVGTMAVGDIETGWNIVRATERCNVGLAVDDFNLFLWDLGSDFGKIRELDPKKIFIAHINDAEKLPFAMLDQMHRCMPGDGRIDVSKYMECLRGTGYEGLVSVEVLNHSIWQKGPEIVIPEAYRKTKPFIM